MMTFKAINDYHNGVKYYSDIFTHSDCITLIDVHTVWFIPSPPGARPGWRIGHSVSWGGITELKTYLQGTGTCLGIGWQFNGNGIEPRPVWW